MLISEFIKIKVRKNFIEYYNNLNYEITNNEATVNTNDLHNGSNAIVKVICDNCGEELHMQQKHYYQSIKRYDNNNYYCKKCKYSRIKQTNIEKYGVENVMQVNSIKTKTMNTQKALYGYSCFGDKKNKKDHIIEKYGDLDTYYNLINIKKKETCLDRYGVENVMNVEEIKLKGQQTCLDRYGVTNPMFLKEFCSKSTSKQINTKLERGLIIPDDKLTEFEKYKKIIRNLVYKHKPELFEKWDGYDYYDGENIKDNLSLNHTDINYPSIDHKISVYFGFKNNLDPFIIGDIDNLCITKRSINSSKCSKNSKEFKKIKILK